MRSLILKRLSELGINKIPDANEPRHILQNIIKLLERKTSLPSQHLLVRTIQLIEHICTLLGHNFRFLKTVKGPTSNSLSKTNFQFYASLFG